MRTLAMVALVVACSHSSPPPPRSEAPPAPLEGSAAPPATSSASSTARPANVTDEMVASIERVVGALTKLADDLDASADCTAATTALRSNKAQMHAVTPDAERIEKQMSTADSATREWFKSTYEPRIVGANEKMVHKMQACSQDADFTAAFQDINSSHR